MLRRTAMNLKATMKKNKYFDDVVEGANMAKFSKENEVDTEQNC